MLIHSGDSLYMLIMNIFCCPVIYSKMITLMFYLSRNISDYFPVHHFSSYSNSLMMDMCMHTGAAGNDGVEDSVSVEQVKRNA